RRHPGPCRRPRRFASRACRADRTPALRPGRRPPRSRGAGRRATESWFHAVGRFRGRFGDRSRRGEYALLRYCAVMDSEPDSSAAAFSGILERERVRNGGRILMLRAIASVMQLAIGIVTLPI